MMVLYIYLGVVFVSMLFSLKQLIEEIKEELNQPKYDDVGEAIQFSVYHVLAWLLACFSGLCAAIMLINTISWVIGKFEEVDNGDK